MRCQAADGQLQMSRRGSSNDTLGAVLRVVESLAHTASGEDYIFRGEPECYERVCSSLYRQYQNIEADSFNIEIVQGEILQEAKKYTHETDDLGILTQIQHYGGQTNLIDFTYDILIALFFACLGSPTENGRVVFLKKSGPTSKYITQPKDPMNRS